MTQGCKHPFFFALLVYFGPPFQAYKDSAGYVFDCPEIHCVQSYDDNITQSFIFDKKPKKYVKNQSHPLEKHVEKAYCGMRCLGQKVLGSCWVISDILRPCLRDINILLVLHLNVNIFQFPSGIVGVLAAINLTYAIDVAHIFF